MIFSLVHSHCDIVSVLLDPILVSLVQHPKLADQSQTFLPHNANYEHFTDLSSFAPKQVKEERKVCSLPNNAAKMNFITQWKAFSPNDKMKRSSQ